MNQTTKPLISIHHSISDKDFILNLAECLNNDGIDTLLNELEINDNRSTYQRINNGRKKSDFFAVVFSQSSVCSQWVQRELNSPANIERFSEQGVSIFPILLEECDIPPLMLDRRYANFKDDAESAYQELVDSIFVFFAGRQEDVDIKNFDESPITQETLNQAVKNPNVLLSMAPRRFEQFVAAIISRVGYDTRLTVQSRNGGVNIWAIEQTKRGLSPRRLIVQCKPYKRPVGFDNVLSLAGVVLMTNADRGLLVTSSTFTRAAREVAGKLPVDLMDRDLLIDWARSVTSRTRE